MEVIITTIVKVDATPNRADILAELQSMLLTCMEDPAYAILKGEDLLMDMDLQNQ